MKETMGKKNPNINTPCVFFRLTISILWDKNPEDIEFWPLSRFRITITAVKQVTNEKIQQPKFLL